MQPNFKGPIAVRGHEARVTVNTQYGTERVKG